MPAKMMVKAPARKPKDSVKTAKRKRIFGKLSGILAILGFALILFSLGPFIQQEILFYLSQMKSQKFVLKSSASTTEKSVPDSPFARLLSSRPIELEPVNRDFALVIERLGINVPVVKDVSVVNTDAYMAALENGVAHAIVSDYPSEDPGNVYIFAHASLNFWRLGKYATVFNLLRHMEEGDPIHVFYEEKDFVYKVVGVEKFKGFDVYPLTRPVLEPLLTLQTCDPPGTTLNRLVVTAKLVEVR